MIYLALTLSVLALVGVVYLLLRRPRKTASPGVVKEGAVFVRQYGADTVLEDYDGNEIMRF